jgi:hypothetical protein
MKLGRSFNDISVHFYLQHAAACAAEALQTCKPARVGFYLGI